MPRRDGCTPPSASTFRTWSRLCQRSSADDQLRSPCLHSGRRPSSQKIRQPNHVKGIDALPAVIRVATLALLGQEVRDFAARSAGGHFGKSARRGVERSGRIAAQRETLYDGEIFYL